MICAACATENEPGRKFCAECGARLAVGCPACGSPNVAGAKFCGECGSPLLVSASAPPTGTPPAAAGQASPVAERRLVTVLFADLVGFTSLSETRDSEDVRELLTRYFDVCRSIVGRYGGAVEKFIGDAVMAVWGAPIAHDDDAERAVRAALDLTAAVTTLGEEAGMASLRARAGVHSGEAAVTLGASGQGMVAGDLVNTASRIQGAAAPGTVLVGPETKLATDAAIDYEDAGGHELKGRAEPVRLWRARRVVALIGGAVRRGEIEPPFTGRDPELRLLKERFHASADERRAHAVSVIGIGGIGKSRLAWEFEKYLDGLAMDVWWHRGRCLAYGDGVSFWALAEMVRGRAGILEEEESGSALSKLRATLELHVPKEEERAFVEPRLAQLLGLEARGPGDQENLFTAWRIFFERLADTGPTIMVFEDLHWADASLLDFIEYLLDWSRDRPIFVVTLARPDLIEKRPTWGAAKRGFTSVLLEPLTGPSIEQMLAGVVADLPGDLSRQILESAEGIPFYAVETLRMLMDRGLLVREEGAFRATGAIGQLEVPPTLQALISARLDGLAPEERRVLQDASVLGRTFTVPGLTAVSGLPEAELGPLLASLVRKELLSVGMDPTSPERGQYGFIQDLVRRIAYDTLSKRDRRPRHLAAADHLAAVGAEEDDDVVEVIASHLHDAYEAVPEAADADALRGRARDAQVRAGERAASLGASVGAQHYFERAAALADDPLAQAELLERAGVMATTGSRPDDATPLFERARRLFEGADAARPAARVAAREAEIQWERGRLIEGLESMDAAFELLEGGEPDGDLAALAAQIARFAVFAGNADLAARRIEAALDIAERLDIPETYAHAVNTKSLILTGRGRDREALALVRDALDAALQHDKPSAALRAYNNLAELLIHNDRFGDAQRVIDDGLALARRVGNRYWEQNIEAIVYPRFALGDWQGVLDTIDVLESRDPEVLSRLVYSQGDVAFGVAIHAYRDEPDVARRILDRYRDMETSADAQERIEYATAQAFLAFARQDPAATRRAANVAGSLAHVLGESDYRVKEAFALEVDAALEQGDVDGAAALVEGPGRRVSRQREHFRLAQSQRLRAAIAAARGEIAGVEDGFKGAIGLFREIDFPFWMARTQLQLGEWLLDQGRDADADTILDEARTTFDGLGAVLWRRRLDAIGAEVGARTG